MTIRNEEIFQGDTKEFLNITKIIVNSNIDKHNQDMILEYILKCHTSIQEYEKQLYKIIEITENIKI